MELFVSPVRSVWGEAKVKPSGEVDESSRPVNQKIYGTNYIFDSVDDVLGEWCEYHQRLTVHLDYSGSIYIGVKIPTGEVRYVSFTLNRLSPISPFLRDLVSTYGHLSNLLGKEVVVSEISDGQITVEHPLSGESDSKQTTDDPRSSADSKEEYTKTDEILTDLTGLIRYLNEKGDGPWIECTCELYATDDGNKAALAVDVCDVTRVFKFPTTSEKGTTYRTIVETVGNGTPADLRGTVEVSLAREVAVSRDIRKHGLHSGEAYIRDTTGCWVLRNPEVTHSEKMSYGSKDSSLRDKLTDILS